VAFAGCLCSAMRAPGPAFCLIAALALPLGASLGPASPSVLTVILNFEGPHSRASVQEMKRESAVILQASGVRLNWHLLGDDPYASYPGLVLMTFRGTCEFEPTPLADETGALAITHASDGHILPFGEVNCDRVVNTARRAMSGTDFTRANQLVGRAMGRVVAHELVHMLTKSAEHGTEGVEQPALSGQQLIENSLPLSAFDIGRLVRERSKQ